jgi:hypothetical protein
VEVLRALGHSWPRECDIQSSLASTHDADGIVPLVEVGSTEPLHRRVSKRLETAFGANAVREFDECVGVGLGRWLWSEFFSRHVSTFQVRPIAWHITTQASGKGAAPVFHCFVYYHQLAGALQNLRTRYVGTLRTGLDSELRTLESFNPSTVDQLARLETLRFCIDELKRFTETIEGIEAHGFKTPELRRDAILDALQSMARRWLGRLRADLRSGPMPDWQARAQSERLDPTFPSWIADAIEHIDRQCVAVAPEAPASDTPDEHLSPAALAELFRRRAPSMIRTALEAICREWQSQFDKVLIQPLREQMKAAEEEYRSLEDKIENKLRRKDLKSKVKGLKAEIAGLAGKSAALAAQIQEWRCPEAETWVEWLATQPLYDEFASLDGRRPPPKTVAEFVSQESQYAPDLNDGVRVNIAPLQKAGILARDVLAPKDVEKAIADRAEWRADERRWCRQGILPRPGWWVDSDGAAFQQQPQERPIPERSM